MSDKKETSQVAGTTKEVNKRIKIDTKLILMLPKKIWVSKF
ncbi:hypothetical protein ACS127_10195 [Amphibacillus sp. Q70]